MCGVVLCGVVWCGVVLCGVKWYGGGVVVLRCVVLCGCVVSCVVWYGGLEWYLAWSSMLSRASSAKSNSTSRARGRPARE